MGKDDLSRRVLILALLVAASPAALGAEAPDLLPDATFPSAHDYFESLLADPTELGYGGTYLIPVNGDKHGEVNLGDYVGLLRWRVRDVGVQWNLGGGANARFNLSTPQNQMEVVDFTAASPLDFHWRKAHTIRTGLWHTSSHLGDDYIKRTRATVDKRSMDIWKTLYSFEPDQHIRVYGGGAFAFNTIGIHGRTSLQTGAELLSPYYGGHHAQVYLAQDLQSWERVGWNPSYTIRLGLRWSDKKRIAAAQTYVEYFTGRRLSLQFHEQRESLWGIGLNFEIGNPTRE
ncbi:MAG: DUF1207 domain-containing protein [Elusimicrobia bacterium]|nr:DUF1207 domain-containing protein [Elusimicrobiota bacterium]